MENFITVNGMPVYATEFAYDNCHKIYVILNEEDRAKFKSYGYDFYPIADLQRAYEDSCPLKFISYSNLDLPNLVDQAVEARFGTFEGIRL